MKIIDWTKAPINELRREKVVLDDSTGALVKNAYGALPSPGSPEAQAIRDAHAVYKRSIGTAYEPAARLNLERVVARVKGERA